MAWGFNFAWELPRPKTLTPAPLPPPPHPPHRERGPGWGGLACLPLLPVWGGRRGGGEGGGGAGEEGRGDEGLGRGNPRIFLSISRAFVRSGNSRTARSSNGTAASARPSCSQIPARSVNAS